MSFSLFIILVHFYSNTFDQKHQLTTIDMFYKIKLCTI